MRGGQADDAAAGIGAVEAGVCATKDFDAFNRIRGEGTEVELAAEIAGIDAIDEHLVGGGVAAADEECGLRAALAKLRGESARSEAKQAGEVDGLRQFRRAKDAGGLAGLRLRRGRAGGGDDDGLAHPFGLQNEIALHTVKLAGVKAGCLQLAKGFGGDDEVKAAFHAGEQLEGTVCAGGGGGDDGTAMNEVDDGAGDFGA